VDIKWIFFLVVYLVFQWLKRRRQRSPQPLPEVEPQTPPDEQQEMPDWLRNLGLGELFEEVDKKEEVEETFEQLDEEAEETVELEEPLPQPEQRPDHGEGPRTEPIWKRERTRAPVPGIKRNVDHPILQYFDSPQKLQKIILMREILGSPRARQRHCYRPFY
jgi:hypothetical protein|tara:strand:+ start:169 stop:654 length:486 start_codon:yes stop_codon:yes gene_type:complete